MADEGDLCEADDGDLCEEDNSKLATARSRIPWFPPRFNEAFHAAKTFSFFAASLLKVKKLQSSPVSETDSSDLREADSGWLARALSLNLTTLFLNATASTKL